MKITRTGVALLIILIIFLSSGCTAPVKNISINKQTVAEYMDGFNAGDHSKILSCLTEDVIWEMPGVYLHSGKAAFDKEIENDAFVGRPVINVTRLVEESDVVIAEGTVKCRKKDGTLLDAVFCDVFVMDHGKIKKLTSYLMFRLS